MRERESKQSELHALRELAKSFEDLCGDLPRLEKYRRDGKGRIRYTPHTLSLFRVARRNLNTWKTAFKKESIDD